MNSEKHEKREKRQSVPQPLKQPLKQSNHHHHQQHPHQYQSYQGSVAPPPPMFSRSRHRISNNRDSSLSPCSSDVMMNHSLNASSGSLSSVSSDRSASTDCVEYVTDVPFAGKFFIRHNSPPPIEVWIFFLRLCTGFVSCNYRVLNFVVYFKYFKKVRHYLVPFNFVNEMSMSITWRRA